VSPAAFVRRLAELCIDLRVEGRHLVARGSLRALMAVAAELHVRRDDLRAHLNANGGGAAT